MKRDWEVVRYILTEVERKEALEKPLFSESSFAQEVLIYHVDLLIEADLLKGEITKRGGAGPRVNIVRLTWEGHQFLDAIRDENAWASTMKKIKDSGAGATFEIVKSVATAYAKEKLGL